MSAAPATSQGLHILTNLVSSTGATTDEGGGGISPFAASELADLGALVADLDNHQDSDFLARLFLNEDDFPSLMDTTSSPSINPGIVDLPPPPPDPSASPSSLDFPDPTPSPPLFMMMPGYSNPTQPTMVQQTVPVQNHPPPLSSTTTNTTNNAAVPFHPPNAGAAFPYLTTGQAKQFAWNPVAVSRPNQTVAMAPTTGVVPVFSRAPQAGFVANTATPMVPFLKPEVDALPPSTTSQPDHQHQPPPPQQKQPPPHSLHPPPPPPPTAHVHLHHAQQPPAEDPRLQRRRDRNRESARACRRRKKEQFEQLQNKVDQLNLEVDITRSQHLEAGLPTLQRLRNDLVSHLEKRLAAPVAGTEGMGAATEIQEVLRTFLSKYGPFSEEKQTILLFHFLQLRNLLLPPHLHFTAWVTQQDEAFFKGERGQCSERASALKLGERHFHDGHTSCGQGLYLWPLLAYELQMKNEQIDKLRKAFAGLNSGQDLSRDSSRMTQCLGAMDEVEKGMLATARSIQKKMEKIQAVLTPQQFIKYKAWVERSREQLGRLRSRATNSSSSTNTSMARSPPNNNMDEDKLKSGIPPLDMSSMAELLDPSRVPWQAASDGLPVSVDLISAGSSQAGEGSEEDDEEEGGEEDQENGSSQTRGSASRGTSPPTNGGKTSMPFAVYPTAGAPTMSFHR